MAFKKGSRDRPGADMGDTPAGPGGGIGKRHSRHGGRKHSRGKRK